MVSSISGYGGSSSLLTASTLARGTQSLQKAQEQLFSKLDTNNDGGVDETELGSFLSYVSSSTGTDASTDAASLLKSLDTGGDGTISEQELTDNSSTLFDALRSQLMSAQLGGAQAPPPPPPPSAESAEEMLTSIDTNGDGSIDKSELSAFLEAKSTESGASVQAPGVDDIFSRDDTDGDGTISVDELEAAMNRRGPPPGPPPGDGAGGDFASSFIASLIEQYGSVGLASAGETSGSSLVATA